MAIVKDRITESVKAAVKAKVAGFVVYEGPSVLDNSPIIGILVPSTNDKTEGGWQLWIMRSDVHPMDAIRSGEDYSVCGNCPLRRTLVEATLDNLLKQDEYSRGCYVIPPPIGKIWKGYHEGRYTRDLAKLSSLAEGEFLRYGAYGDPAAIPFEVLFGLRQYGWRKTAGYTHQISHENFDPRLVSLLMVSCDSLQDRAKAKALGARTFRIDWLAQGLQAGEIWCPSDVTSCRRCGLCNGQESQAKDIVITQHGNSANKHTRLVMNLRAT